MVWGISMKRNNIGLSERSSFWQVDPLGFQSHRPAVPSERSVGTSKDPLLETPVSEAIGGFSSLVFDLSHSKYGCLVRCPIVNTQKTFNLKG